MTTQSASPSNSAAAIRASWLPLMIIVLAQLQMGFNINALPVSIGPIAEDLHAPATAIGTALVIYSLFAAAFVMLGAKVGNLFGERRVFQVSVIAHGASMALMALSATANTMNIAQAISGISAAALVPTLVVLIAANYRDRQQAQALGILASIPAVASGVADSPVNAITPLMVYLPFILTITQRYQKEAGMGTLISLMLPFVIAILIAWILLFVVWFLLNIPLGPGYLPQIVAAIP